MEHYKGGDTRWSTTEGGHQMGHYSGGKTRWSTTERRTPDGALQRGWTPDGVLQRGNAFRNGWRRIMGRRVWF